MNLRLVLFSLIALVASPAAAQQYSFPSFSAETVRPAAGSTIKIGLRFDPRPGWHIYWSNPGEAGIAPSIDWKLPKGVTVGALQHPAPSVIHTAGLVSYVHEGPVTLVADLKLPKNLPAGQALPLVANIRWASCSASLCVPEQAQLPLDLVVGTAPEAATHRTSFQAKLDKLPRRLSAAGTLRKTNGGLELRVPLVNVDPKSATFLPLTSAYPMSATQVVARDGRDLVISVPFKGDAPKSLDGVIVSAAAPAYLVHASRVAAGPKTPTQISALATHRMAGEEPAQITASSTKSPPSAPKPGPVPSAPTASMVHHAESAKPTFLGLALLLIAAGLAAAFNRRKERQTGPSV